MKGYKITDTNFSQEVNLPAGTYTYSCRVIPVGTSYTFKIDSNLFTFEDLVAGVLSARIKYTFELAEPGVVFYPSNTLGDSIFDPQIEEGVFATTPGAHALDFERLISEAGIEIDHEALSLYAKKADVSAEIKIQADQINSTVGGLSNDVDGLRGSVTSIEQTTTSISATVSNHTSQIAGFQITVDQIYAAIEDAGSGEFSSILQRLDLIELRVGDISGNLSTLTQTVDGFEARVQTAEGNLSTLTQTVNGISAKVFDEHENILSQITQDGETILIQASQIKLEGLVTANQNFKILADGSIEAKNGKFTGEINATSGNIGGLTIEDGKLLVGNINGNRFELDPYSRRIRLINNAGQLMGQIYFSSGDTQNDIGAIIEMNHFYQGLKRSSVCLGGVMSDVTIQTYNESGVEIGETNYRHDGVYINGQKVL